MFERFTDRARRTVVLAQEEARQLGHNYIGTEHLLLGLLAEGQGVAARVLEPFGVALESVREQVAEIIGPGHVEPEGHVPFTPRAKKAMELSLRESRQLGHRYIGTEHILLGLLAESEGVGAQILQRLGADLDRVRRRVVALTGGEPGEHVETIDVLDALTPEALDALVAARREARRAGLDTVDLGQLLAGLLSVPTGAAARVLGPLIPLRAPADAVPGGPLPLSAHVCSLIAVVATTEGPPVGTGHLAAALVADDAAAELLRETGADVTRVRHESRRLHGDGGRP